VSTTLALPDVDPRQRPYQPYGGALRLFYCKAPEVLIEGPADTGKSRGVLEKIHLQMMKYAGIRGLIVRKTRASMTESVLVTFETRVVPPDHPVLSGPTRQFRHSYTYPNKSELVVGGLDNPDKIMSTEYDVIAVFEATETNEDDWEKLSIRCRNGVMPYNQLIGDCNPAGPQHYLNQRCLRNQTERILSRHEDNPSITPERLAKLRALTGVRRMRLYEGKWAAQEGLVYDEWGDANLIDRMPEGWHAWKKHRSIDFGYTNPFVHQWWVEDPDGRLYLYREIYRTKRLVEDHARDIKRLSEGETYVHTVADHDAEDRATLGRRGVHTTPARKAITPGIQAVQARIRPAGDGRPRLFVLKGALVEADPELIEAKRPYSTEQEFGDYVWPKGADGKPNKELPVDDNNHGMDAMRYMVAALDLKIEQRPPPSTPRSRSYVSLG
jgi:PBSX family phage terminase large subunit